MKCCVPFCNISNNTLISQKVTYHKFPVDKYLRAAWLEALGIDESQVSDAAVVCSLHFNDSHFYDGKNGVKMVQRGAVPFVQVCMICLDTNCKLYPLGKYNLEQSYETITGLSLQQVQSHLTPTVCSECAQRLTNCNKFRGKSLRAHAVLLELFRKHSLLTVTNVKTINRSIFGLKSSITPKTFKPNHCDLNVIDDSYVEIELEGVEEKSIIKVEKQDEIVVAFDCKGKDQNESHENNSFTELAKKNNIIKNDLNEDVDIDIDIDFLNDDNDDDFLDDDDRLLDDTLKVVTDNKVNVTDHNLPERNTEVRLVDKINSDDTELVCNDNDKESPKNDVKNVKRTRKVTSANIKNSRNKVQTANKKAVTKKAVGPKTKRAPNSKVKSETTKSTRTPKNQVLTTFEITKLSHEEQLEEINKRKESSNYLNSSFQCNVCYRGFVSETTYTRHMEKHSKSFGELQCPVCKQYLKAQYALQKHVNSSHATRYSCTLCEFTTMACESARMHEFWHKGTKYKCTHCDAEFLKYTSYITHVRVKHPSDYICSQCGYSYLSEKGLLCHIARIHRLDKVEKPEGPECEECKVRFASETAYAQHLKVSPKHHTPETRAVNQAVPPRSYKKGAGYRKQDEDGDFVTCEQCGIRLKDYSMYMFHFKREHPDKNRTQYAPRPRAGLCELCGKSFQTPYHLKYHMSKHTGQKDFQCDVCEKRFRIKRFLDMHKATHAPREARRQYECPVCGKTFTSPSSLNRHVWIHKGKSFKCEICDKGFSNASERNCHVSHVHMKVPWPKRHRGPNRAGRPSLITDDNYDE